MDERDEHKVNLRMMLLDAKFSDAPSSARSVPPTVHLYGVVPEGQNVCVIINDFLPYFWFPAPSFPSGVVEVQYLDKLKEYLDEHILVSKKKSTNDDNSFVAHVTTAYRRPLMYYRPGGPTLFLKIEVWRSKDIPTVAKELMVLARGKKLEHVGFLWKDCTCYEDDIKLGMRFFCDTKIAGGSWLAVLGASIVHFSFKQSRCEEEFVASWSQVRGLTPDATQFMEFSPLLLQHTTTAHVLAASGENTLDSLDTASTNAQLDHTGLYSKLLESFQCLALSPLRVLVVSVISGKDLGGHNMPLQKGKNQRYSQTLKGGRFKMGPSIVDKGTVDMEDLSQESVEVLHAGASPLPSRDPVLMIATVLISEQKKRKAVFVQGEGVAKSPPGVEIFSFDSEHALLMAWQEFFRIEADPDVVCVYQLKNSIRYIAERFRVLKLGPFDIGRFKGHATEVKSVVSYGKNWVKQQARMTATSNQEVFRASIEGRAVIDMLRVVLIAYNLSTFTLEECCQVFLGKTKEALNSFTIAKLWKGHHGGIYRLIKYSLNEAEVTWELMQKLQTIPETIEMARVTGLSLSDALYKAQMVRVQSLLLRSSHKEGWLLGGPTISDSKYFVCLYSGQLSESPYLIHPKDNKTSGFYKDPVAILDFASLYPSVYMAHNLCYTTLVHPEDVELLPEGSLMKSPTGASFVVPSVRQGILPRICGALIAARKLAREEMASLNVTSSEFAVLDARQKALKLCSNALYGFTGAGASPQQALPLADSCLSMGAAACKRAVELVNETFANARVIYAQTDSVFIHCLGTKTEEAIQLGHQAADIISQAFPSPMHLKFEKVLCPFLLLQVNRYAGKEVISPNDEKGALFVRGIESERRDVPPFVRSVCKRALQKILLDEDVEGALTVCKDEIRRLVSGKCSMMELVMTGGLWRVDNNDISRLASSAKSPKKEMGGPSTAEEGRGPHVALAVKLKRKDPDRQFHIGERIQYVLVENSSKFQDDMAEDPIDAIREKMQLNFHVYLENKLRKPLESILDHVADSGCVRDVFNVSHNVVSPFLSSSTSNHGNQSSVRRFFKSQSPCLSCRKPLSDDHDTLCKECWNRGAKASVVLSLLNEKRESEKKLFGGQARCLSCHSGGSFNTILCTNTDCPIFYMRCETVTFATIRHISL